MAVYLYLFFIDARPWFQGDTVESLVYCQSLVNACLRAAETRPRPGDALLLGPDTETLRLRVPDSKVGLIIGKGGGTIRYLTQESGTLIEIPKECSPGESFREITITGSQEAVKRCEVMIYQTITPWHEQQQQQQHVQQLEQQQQQQTHRASTGSISSSSSDAGSTMLLSASLSSSSLTVPVGLGFAAAAGRSSSGTSPASSVGSHISARAPLLLAPASASAVVSTSTSSSLLLPAAVAAVAAAAAAARRPSSSAPPYPTFAVGSSLSPHATATATASASTAASVLLAGHHGPAPLLPLRLSSLAGSDSRCGGGFLYYFLLKKTPATTGWHFFNHPRQAHDGGACAGGPGRSDHWQERLHHPDAARAVGGASARAAAVAKLDVDPRHHANGQRGASGLLQGPY
jgi:hypothetical protein